MRCETITLGVKKLLYKLFFGFILFFITNLAVANFNIELKIDKKEIELGEDFNISITIIGSGNIDDVIAGGIREFTIIGKRQSKAVSIINGDKKKTMNIVFNLKSLSIGEFELGPVIIKTGGEEIIGEEKFNINVIESKNIISKDKVKNNQIKSEEKNPEIIEDLYDIDTIKNYIPKFNFYFIFIILFFIIFYFLLKKLLGQKNKVIVKEEEKKEVDKSILIKLKLRKLKENIKALNKTEFYAIINMLFREYFEHLGVKNASKKTYEELKDTKLEKEKIFNLFKKSYFNEFDSKKDDKDFRKKIIDKFIKIIEKEN